MCPPGGGLHRLHRLSLPLTDSRIPLHAESEELSRETSTPTPRGWLSFDEGGSGQPLGPGSLGPETPRVRNGKDRPVHLQRRVSDPGQGGGGTKAGAERLGLSRHCPRFPIGAPRFGRRCWGGSWAPRPRGPPQDPAALHRLVTLGRAPLGWRGAFKSTDSGIKRPRLEFLLSSVQLLRAEPRAKL